MHHNEADLVSKLLEDILVVGGVDIGCREVGLVVPKSGISYISHNL